MPFDLDKLRVLAPFKLRRQTGFHLNDPIRKDRVQALVSRIMEAKIASQCLFVSSRKVHWVNANS